MNKKLFLIAVFLLLFSILIPFDNSNCQWLKEYYQMKGKLDRNFLKRFALLDSIEVTKFYKYSYSRISLKNRKIVKEWSNYQKMKNLLPNEKLKVKSINKYFFKKPQRTTVKKFMYVPTKK